MILPACNGYFNVPRCILRASCRPQGYVFSLLPSPRVFCISCTPLSDLEASPPPLASTILVLALNIVLTSSLVVVKACPASHRF
jgi:hypothetical protein